MGSTEEEREIGSMLYGGRRSYDRRQGGYDLFSDGGGGDVLPEGDGFGGGGFDRKSLGSMGGLRNGGREEGCDSLWGFDEAELASKMQSMGVEDSGYGAGVFGNGGRMSGGGGYHHSLGYGGESIAGLDSVLSDELMMLRLQEEVRLRELSEFGGYAGVGFNSRRLGRKRNGIGFNPSVLHDQELLQGFRRPMMDRTMRSPFSDEYNWRRPSVDYDFFSPEMVSANPAWGIDSGGYHLQQGLMMKPNVRSAQYRNPRMCPMNGFPGFGSEDSFILQGNRMDYTVKNPRCDFRKGLSRCEMINRKPSVKSTELLSSLEMGDWDFLDAAFPLFDIPLSDFSGLIYETAKDQSGCRFLQKKLAEGKPQDIQMMFSELIHHMVELMMNPFANYLIQLMIDVCTDDQIIQITNVVTAKPMELVQISLDRHGTRAVQKLIHSIKTDEQIASVATALEPGFPGLITDINGNHVVQRCLECFPIISKQFIVKAASRYCIDIATHQDGCRVLQRCITDAVGDLHMNLCAKVAESGLFLAQNSYGNYVIQFVIEQGIPSVNAILHSRFEGNYVQLSIQKESSNVVEKCIRHFGYEAQCEIIQELLSVSQFDYLLQDKFANYVIKTALNMTEGTPIYSSLVAAILPYQAAIGNSPYCKRIFSLIKLKVR